MSQLVEIPIDKVEGREVLVVALGCATELLIDPAAEDILLEDLTRVARIEIARRRDELSPKETTDVPQ